VTVQYAELSILCVSCCGLQDSSTAQTGPCEDGQAEIRLPREVVQSPSQEVFKRIKPWVSWSELTAEPVLGRRLDQDLDVWIDPPTN